MFAGLQIAMDDARAVRAIERVGDLQRRIADLDSGSGPRARRVRERLALESAP